MTEPSDRRVYIVDDDSAVRESLHFLLAPDFTEVRLYADADAFIEDLRPEEGGCLILDVRLPGMSGLALLELLGRRSIALPTIVITGHGDVPMAVEAMQLGAFDFVEKPFAEETLLEKLDRAFRKDSRLRADRAEIEEIKARFALLSRRERQVMDHVVLGNTSRQIGAQLGISEKTVETHRARIIEKTETPSLAHLVRIYFTVYSRRRGDQE